MLRHVCAGGGRYVVAESLKERGEAKREEGIEMRSERRKDQPNDVP